jgi:sugar lactone lactonase YvrE
MVRILVGVLAALTALFLIWLAWPARVDPAFWDEPEPPALTGVLEPRGRLAGAEQIRHEAMEFSEDVAIGADGALYAGQPDGSLLRLREAEGGWAADTVATITDKPVLGLRFGPDGHLYAAASDGLYAVDVETGEVEMLTDQGGSRPLGFSDDLDIGPDGTVYFTEASWKFANPGHGEISYHLDMAENRPYGELLAWDPASGETRLLVDGLYFANGVAMAADNQSVFFIETYRYRLSRYWLEGQQAGEVEIIAENLPGIPDGVSSDGEGRLYIAMDTQRVPIMRLLHRNPFLTRMITKLPESLWLRAGQVRGFILVTDEEGNYLDSYHDPDGRFGFIANVVPHEGELWIGSLTEGVIGRFTPPAEE